MSIGDSYEMISHNNLLISRNKNLSKFSKNDKISNNNFSIENNQSKEAANLEKFDYNEEEEFSGISDSEIIGNNLYEIRDENGRKFVLKDEKLEKDENFENVLNSPNVKNLKNSKNLKNEKNEEIKKKINMNEARSSYNRKLNKLDTHLENVQVKFLKTRTQRVPTFNFIEENIDSDDKFSIDNKKITSIQDNIRKKLFKNKKNEYFKFQKKNLKIKNLGNYFSKKNFNKKNQDFNQDSHNIDNYFKKIQSKFLKKDNLKLKKSYSRKKKKK